MSETLRQRFVRLYLQRDDLGFFAALDVVDELLAACKGIVISIGDDDPNWRGESGLQAVKDAIAKAEGA